MHEVPEETVKCFKDCNSWLCIFVQETALFVSEPPLSAFIHYVLAWHTDPEEGVPTCHWEGRFSTTAGVGHHNGVRTTPCANWKKQHLGRH